MSVDMIMYKVQQLNEDELRKICCMNVADLDELDGWELKAYSLEEMSRNPDRFKYIKPFLKPVELMYTHTDYKACFIQHGMPADTNSYSYQHYRNSYTVWFDCEEDCEEMHLTEEDVAEFTTTNSRTYYVVKRKCIETDVDGWASRVLMDALKETIEENKVVHLSYTPIHLSARICELLCKALVELYDADALYPSAEISKFMIEIMRTIYKHDDGVFIEFQT